MILAWIVLFRATVTAKPSEMRWMSEREREYLAFHVPEQRRSPIDARNKHRIPWRAMLTSPQLLACLCVVYAFNIMVSKAAGKNSIFFLQLCARASFQMTLLVSNGRSEQRRQTKFS